ncbi:PEP-CTERM sorting domain-containing protein [Roseibacillus persicicus]|uniref:PEP-CTERM sorting domain-containing protein n=1 Tax=Roseibacillus persicicus TaxID=454148 RepID=UPI00167AD5F1|nr:PEP-CTERM sorting domain-containing protein [Roseibacillus persicicus]
MRLSIFALLSAAVFCSKVMASSEEIGTTHEHSASAVPESSVAILFAGLLWFLLLRKRT